MRDDISKILEIVTQEQKLNAARYGEFKGSYGELKGSYGELKSSFGELKGSLGELKSSFGELKDLFIHEQDLNAARYAELKGSIEEIKATMATREELNYVFESLSRDISAAVVDHSKLKKRVDGHDKRLKKLEFKVFPS